MWNKIKSMFANIKQKIRKWLSMFNWNCNNKQSEKCTELAQRDFFYIAIIFVLIVIFILTMTLSSSSEANNRFSFASTLVSIVLSVVAIIMTIVSEYKNERSKNSIDIAIYTLETVSSELRQQAKKQIEELHLLNNELKSRFIEINSKLDIIQNSMVYMVKPNNGENVDIDWIGFEGARK